MLSGSHFRPNDPYGAHGKERKGKRKGKRKKGKGKGKDHQGAALLGPTSPTAQVRLAAL